tara:strand:- start:67 stop:573 length:507 start_codon:yes stop_codon:yes gene_type:complete
MIKVKLDLYELMASSQTGLLRVFESIRLKQSWGYGFKGDLNEQISKSISGSCAELACSKYLETDYTHHVNHGSNPDLLYHDLHLQVRSQRPKENNFLIIRPKSKKNELYILVIDKAPIFELHGFINSSHILGTKKYLSDLGKKDRPPCHAIPLNQLTPIKLLKDGAWN